MNAGIHNYIKNEYEKKRKKALDDLLRRKEEVYSKLPVIEHLDSQLHLLAIKFNKMILLGKGPAQKLADELTLQIENIKKEKQIQLSKGGFPAGYLVPVYVCSHCMDTGYIDAGDKSERCVCYKQQLIDQLYNHSNLNILDTDNFSSFNAEYYPNVVDEARYGIKKSPRAHILGIKEKCHKFIENFNSHEEKNLFFCGPAGVGKTFMTACIAKELLESGRTVLYQTAPLLFDTISSFKKNSSREDVDEGTPYKSIFDVELLIIDDLGTESQTASRYAELLNILNTRQANNLKKPCKTIISTNIQAQDLHRYYTERVSSRIIGSFALYKFAGEDIRSIKTLRGR